MFIDINEIECGEGISFDREIDLADMGGADGDDFSARTVRLAGRLERGDSGVALTARLTAVVGLSCSRCTEPIELPLAIDIALTLVPDAVEYASDQARIEVGDASIFYAKDGKADLRQLAAEQIYLDIPLKPVCKPDCKGLCPQCGANRNGADCGCVLETVDPRLAPLLRFRKRT